MNTGSLQKTGLYWLQYLGFVNNEFNLSKFEDFIRGELVM